MSSNHITLYLDKNLEPPLKLSKHPESSNSIQHVRPALELLNDKSIKRAFEIVHENTAANTHRAHTGDLGYWQAWLIVVGFSFTTPITKKEILSFIIPHAEGLDPEIDQLTFNRQANYPGRNTSVL